ncbi:uncharacterized protein LOC103695858 [Phoenix dactylifera]|uniref:Uncharacterized protein LOC103695858 n=1 Tax=Phoenix dactylifera TaxID=42345 RepID=A0A8B9AN40_PHODC|nr:uncharacterized protein LOC103695858 [Phoenix dactylifera]XP_026656488.1 uncharacterized protein LOC103695858 [Phoenix dactylifera]XP_026656489.1 uncharacterized protein LOC103695858 [Phoenix dactylifera]XP_038987800.1 uncharacterized protein LOC103695858 [Phoenix dactylifera]XP_038987801.1 uncharacterized protein LOC103695858 [Phoenix dactylifera]XP_038987802.1 uncharacterized protein LOC103695858 [Phoenix dactylifera]
MPWTTEVINGNGDSIKVGTTGTIGSLMSQELESMKQSSQASSSTRGKHQTGPVTVPCGASPKKTLQRKNPPNESGSSRSSSDTDHRTPGYGHKPRHNPRKNGHRVPMLGSDDIPIDRNSNIDKMEKKGQPYIVEIVDLKCSNPMSSRLKKLGFSKLSESIA